MIKDSRPRWINLQGWSEMGRAGSWLADQRQQKQPELTTAYVMHCSSPPGFHVFASKAPAGFVFVQKKGFVFWSAHVMVIQGVDVFTYVTEEEKY